MRTTLKILLATLASAGTLMATATFADDLVTGHNGFAFDLYQAISPGGDNIFFSPLSISSALSMTYAGAKNQTAAEMQKVMHLPANEKTLHEGNRVLQQLLEKNLDAGSQMHLANSLWPDRSENLLDSFVQCLKENYGAETQSLDFRNNPDEAAAAINKWVEEKTKGRIVDLLQPGDLTTDTRLVLANAIVFDGKWQQAFDPAKTRPLSFRLADGNLVQVQGMVQKDDFRFAQMDNFKLLEVPFSGLETSLLIAMPDDAAALEELESNLNPDLIDQWLAGMRVREISLTMPRFEMDYRVDLAKVLVRMGMEDAFQSSADFSGMTGDKSLFISKVIHQATLKVHEEGAEAAAATAVVMEKLSESMGFRVDRPFLFMIRHRETGTILFLGRLMNPAA
jgi:serine protease inhibitor